jgi:hypothetical protein
MYIILWILVAVAVVFLAAKLVLMALGTEKIVVDASAPFTKVSQDDGELVIAKKLAFSNEGKQCATIMDAMVRPLLPYEQYDGIEARGKAEREGYPREDDYFEAVIIQKKGDRNHEDHLNIYAKLAFRPRKGLSLEEALSHMVDIPVDVIWQETGRAPYHYRKVQLKLSAEEIAKLAGVELVKDF